MVSGLRVWRSASCVRSCEKTYHDQRIVEIETRRLLLRTSGTTTTKGTDRRFAFLSVVVVKVAVHPVRVILPLHPHITVVRVPNVFRIVRESFP